MEESYSLVHWDAPGRAMQESEILEFLSPNMSPECVALGSSWHVGTNGTTTFALDAANLRMLLMFRNVEDVIWIPFGIC
jgi:hypothetical protein